MSRTKIDQTGNSSVIVCFVLECGILNNELWGLLCSSLELEWIAIVTAILLNTANTKKQFFAIIWTIFFSSAQTRMASMANFFTDATFFSCMFFVRCFQCRFFRFAVDSNADYSLMVMLCQTLAASWISSNGKKNVKLSSHFIPGIVIVC